MQMKYLRLLLIATLVAQATYAQRVYVGVFGGVAAYSGDLTSKIFPKKVTKPAVSITGNYEINSRFTLKTALTYTHVGAYDKYGDDPSRVRRNLSFETNLIELSTVGEYYLLELENTGFSPYVFGGVGVFRFNPYAFDQNGQKVYLHPLSTEGQGLAEYPDRKPYHLTQLALPFGGGLKFELNEQVRIGLELGMRKLFTEYLDDVSTTYVNWEYLMNAKGPVAVEMSYRGDELDAGPNNSIIPYPAVGHQRGDPSKKDYYYFSGVHLSYLFNSSNRSGTYRSAGRKSRMGCPTNIY